MRHKPMFTRLLCLCADIACGAWPGSEDVYKRQLFETPKAKGELFSGLVVDTREEERINDLQGDKRFQDFVDQSRTIEGGAAAVDSYWRRVGSVSYTHLDVYKRQV